MKNALAGFALCLPLTLSGCGSLLDSKLAAPQTYVLRLPANGSPAAQPSAGSLLVQRPEAGPGLESNRIALLRSERRFDFYAASLWAAPAPDIVESVVVDALRGAGTFSAVLDDVSPYAPLYDLRISLRRFEADYTGGGTPTVFVALDCTLGRHRDRALLATFSAQGSARAAEDRLSSVVAAFEAATSAAMAELTRATTAAIASEKPPAAN
ncbi:MAG TPA: ABC-type transport auxiliary lipoprotein family protein [Steroidobacteraceae bacterium]|nr:ABC-type transport auxiliary lipoprotein family protein [Steroidobacteraceae bacterium]